MKSNNIVLVIYFFTNPLSYAQVNHAYYNGAFNTEFNDYQMNSKVNNNELFTIGKIDTFTFTYEWERLNHNSNATSYGSLTKTDYSGTVLNSTTFVPYNFRYRFEAANGEVQAADFKAIAFGNSNDIYCVGNIENVGDMHITRIDKNTGLAVLSKRINDPTISRFIPTDMVTYNNEFYIVGYVRYRTDLVGDGDKLFIIKFDNMLNILRFQVFYHVGLGNDMTYPIRANVHYNYSLSKDLIYITGEITNLTSILGPNYDHPSAFLGLYDMTSPTPTLTLNIYSFLLSTGFIEGLYSRCFTYNEQKREFFLGGMYDLSLTQKAPSILRVDENGNLIDYFTFYSSIPGYTIPGQIIHYPSSIHYENGNIDLVSEIELGGYNTFGLTNLTGYAKHITYHNIDYSAATSVVNNQYIIDPLNYYSHSRNSIKDPITSDLTIFGSICIDTNYSSSPNPNFDIYSRTLSQNNDIQCYGHELTSSNLSITINDNTYLPISLTPDWDEYPVIVSTFNLNHSILCQSTPSSFNSIQDIYKSTDNKRSRVIILDVRGQVISEFECFCTYSEIVLENYLDLHSYTNQLLLISITSLVNGETKVHKKFILNKL